MRQASTIGRERGNRGNRERERRFDGVWVCLCARINNNTKRTTTMVPTTTASTNNKTPRSAKGAHHRIAHALWGESGGDEDGRCPLGREETGKEVPVCIGLPSIPVPIPPCHVIHPTTVTARSLCLSLLYSCSGCTLGPVPPCSVQGA